MRPLGKREDAARLVTELDSVTRWGVASPLALV
jgi:hypothetical protein